MGDIPIRTSDCACNGLPINEYMPGCRRHDLAPVDDLEPCVFCAKIAAGDCERRWPAVVCFEPLNAVTPGHMLVVPVVHVPDVAADPFWSGQAMHAAAELAAQVGDCNVITSRGTAATQTIRHLHIHVVPRRAGDGLALPWTPTTEETTDAHRD